MVFTLKNSNYQSNKIGLEKIQYKINVYIELKCSDQSLQKKTCSRHWVNLQLSLELSHQMKDTVRVRAEIHLADRAAV